MYNSIIFYELFMSVFGEIKRGLAVYDERAFYDILPKIGAYFWKCIFVFTVAILVWKCYDKM